MPPPPLSESQLQFTVIDMAKRLGLLVHHCRAAQVRTGKWVTPVQGHTGFCDLVIAGVGGVLFRELKGERTHPTPEQMKWLGTLDESGQDAAIWRPEHLRDGTIEAALKALARPREAAS